MATEVEQHVSVENESGIGWIRFNRPEKMNAIGALTRKQLAESIKQAERDDAVRVVVLTGSCQDDDPNRVVALRLLDRLGELLPGERSDRVHLLGPVESDPADAAFVFDAYVLLDFSRHISS